MKKNDLFSTLGIKLKSNAFEDELCDTILKEMFESYAQNEIELKDISLRKTFKHQVSNLLEKTILEKVEKEIKPELEAFFGMKLKYSKPIQSLIYNKGHFFKPHKDDIKTNDGKNFRKITTVFFLNHQGNDPAKSDYEGGTLNLYGLLEMFPNRNFPIPCLKGTMVAFKADTIHEVTEIIRGQRCSLVVWFE